MPERSGQPLLIDVPQMREDGEERTGSSNPIRNLKENLGDSVGFSSPTATVPIADSVEVMPRISALC